MPWALHLDDHLGAVAEPGPVHLGDGGGGERRVVEGVEHVVHAHAELVLDDLADLLRRDGLHLVLQADEGVQVGLGEQVGPGRQDLAQLHERRSHRLQVTGEALGVGGDGVGVAACRFEVLELRFEAGLVQQARAGVPDDQAQDVGMTRETGGLARREDAHRRPLPGGAPFSHRLGTTSGAGLDGRLQQLGSFGGRVGARESSDDDGVDVVLADLVAEACEHLLRRVRCDAADHG